MFIPLDRPETKYYWLATKIADFFSNGCNQIISNITILYLFKNSKQNLVSSRMDISTQNLLMNYKLLQIFRLPSLLIFNFVLLLCGKIWAILKLVRLSHYSFIGHCTAFTLIAVYFKNDLLWEKKVLEIEKNFLQSH